MTSAEGEARARLQKPFAGFKNFADCVVQQESKGKSHESAVKICGALMRDFEKEAREMPTDEQVTKAVWTRAFINSLPDSAFLYVAPGGKKDSEGKTVPRSLRYFPYRDKSGKIDVPHLRNAIARIPQSTAPGLSMGKKKALQARARQLLVKKSAFALSWQQFLGDVAIRAATARAVTAKGVCHLFIERPFGVEAFQLAADPTGDCFEKIDATRREFRTEAASALLDFEGDAPPQMQVGGIVLNPAKSVPSTLALLAKGEVELLADEVGFRKFRIKGGGFEGVYTLTEEVAASNSWVLRNSSAPDDDDTGEREEPTEGTPPLVKCRGCGSCGDYVEFAKRRGVRLLKQDPQVTHEQEERFVLGVVLEPDTADSQDDVYSADEVRKTAHRWMEYYRHLGVMHRELVDGDIRILESYVAPTDFEIEGETVKKGTWLLAARIAEDKLWEKVKAGEFTGWSIGGHAIREPAE